MRVNLRLLLCLVVGLGVCAAGGHYLRGTQLRRNAGAFLVQARQAEAEAEQARPESKPALYQKAAHYLQRYLAYQTRNVAERVRLAELLEKVARRPDDYLQALLVYDEALRQEPNQPDLRRRVAKLAMHPAVNRFTDAMDHLEQLGGPDAPDGELHDLYAQCLDASGKPAEAGERYAKATQIVPVALGTYVRYATLLRRKLDRPQQADALVREMVQRNATAMAFVHAHDYWLEFDRGKAGQREAATALAEAQRLAPEDPEVVLRAANALVRETGRPPALVEARQVLTRALKAHPQEPRLYRLLSVVEMKAGPGDEALAVLRQGLDVLPGNPDLLWGLADLLLERLADLPPTVRQKETALTGELGDVIGRLKEAGLADPLLDYLKARDLLARQEWPEAADALERLRPDLDGRRDLLIHADLLLGRCYERMGDLPRQYGAYRRVTRADPFSIPGGLGLGETLEAMGKYEEALTAYRVVLHQTPEPRVLLKVAELLVRRNQILPARDQQWEEIDQVLDPAARIAETTVEASILRARMLVARGRLEQAVNLLVEARTAHPREPKLWVTLAVLADVQAPGKGLEALAEARKAIGDNVELRLAEGAYWVRAGGPDAKKVLTRLGDGVERFAVADQTKLLRGLAGLNEQLGDGPNAGKLWQQLARLDANDLGVRVALFDLALEAKDAAKLGQCVEEIRRIEGGDGTLWKYARATQLIEQARGGDRGGLKEARVHLDAVLANRPGWARAYSCAAALEEEAGNKAMAIVRYQQAFERGERNPNTYRRAVLLLCERRRFADADTLLKRLPRQEEMPGEVRRLAAEVALQAQGSSARTLDLARQAVRNDSKDYRDYVWLGQILALSQDQYDEAEQVLRKAWALAPAEPVVWVALVQLLARREKVKEAETLLPQAEQQLPPRVGRLVLAACHELLGQNEKAAAKYAEAQAAEPKDTDVWNSAAKFYLRIGSLAEAERCLLRIMELKSSPDEVAWARRTLAIVLYKQGGYQQKRRALAMLDLLENAVVVASLDDMHPEDIRTRTLILGKQWSRRGRLEVIRLLEHLAARQPLSPEDQFLLARAYESVGRWSDASKRMSTALETERDDPLLLGVYVESLLRHKEWGPAGLWLGRLEAKQPFALSTIQLKARLLKGRGNDADAAATVESYAARKDADLFAAASLLDALDLSTAAERVFRRFAHTAKYPEAKLVYAAFLGRQQRTAEALDRCERAAGCSPQTVGRACLDVLYSAADPRPFVARVEGWLERNVKAETRTDFTMHFAALRNIQGRYAEAGALYRQVLAKDSQNALALNNLAVLLVLHDGKGKDALAMLQNAEEQRPPAATRVDIRDIIRLKLGDVAEAVLADTRALTRLKLGEVAAAVGELEELVANAPSAGGYFHLAMAHDAAGDAAAARAAFRQAQEYRLKATELHRLEQESYQALMRKYGG